LQTYLKKKGLTHLLILVVILMVPAACLAIMINYVGNSGSTKGDVSMAQSLERKPNDPSAQQALAQADSQTWLNEMANRYDNPEQAQSALAPKQQGLKFKIALPTRMPKDKRPGKPTGIYLMNNSVLDSLMKDPSTMQRADASRISYPNGISLGVGFKTDQALDFKQLVASAQVQDDGVHTGLPVLATVHEFQGWGGDPGYDSYPALESTNYRGAFLEWTDNNLSGPKNDPNITLNSLINLANSMY
jgi:hypothetical protein